MYVALLRGINVGGKNLIGMPALKASFEAGGFEDVVTYIQSGNVLFRARGPGTAVADWIERMLSTAFDYRASVVVRSHAQMRAIVEGASRGFGRDPKAYGYNVIFLKGPLTASAALKQVTSREGVDVVSAGRGVLYWSILASRAAQSRISRVASMPIYQNITIRNWNTTTRLLQMMDETSRAARKP
jgi:uncharacterized protein (DUF1697 family)